MADIRIRKSEVVRMQPLTELSYRNLVCMIDLTFLNECFH